MYQTVMVGVIMKLLRACKITNGSTARATSYSTMSFLRPRTNATTSCCSDYGTLNFARVAAACPRNTFQSLSLIFMPRWASSISLPR